MTFALQYLALGKFSCAAQHCITISGLVFVLDVIQSALCRFCVASISLAIFFRKTIQNLLIETPKALWFKLEFCFILCVKFI